MTRRAASSDALFRAKSESDVSREVLGLTSAWRVGGAFRHLGNKSKAVPGNGND
jgi:hypothetical protein